MPTTLAHVLEEAQFSIPAGSQDLEGFRRWARSERFPERGRIDYLEGDIHVDMSPEDLYTHGVVKTEIASQLQLLIAHQNLGSVYVDRARVSSPRSGLSAEPDVTVVLWSSLESGQVREIAFASGRPDRYIELEGAPDLVVEIISDGSVAKDTRRLPGLYADAGIPELWLVDARGEQLQFEIRDLVEGAYRSQVPDSEGWLHSALLGTEVRLHRQPRPLGRYSYRLERREGA